MKKAQQGKENVTQFAADPEENSICLPVGEIRCCLQQLYQRLGKRMNCTARSYYLSLYTTYWDRSVNAPILKCAFHYSLYKHKQLFDRHLTQTSPHNYYYYSYYFLKKLQKQKFNP